MSSRYTRWTLPRQPACQSEAGRRDSLQQRNGLTPAIWGGGREGRCGSVGSSSSTPAHPLVLSHRKSATTAPVPERSGARVLPQPIPVSATCRALEASPDPRAANGGQPPRRGTASPPGLRSYRPRAPAPESPTWCPLGVGVKSAGAEEQIGTGAAGSCGVRPPASVRSAAEALRVRSPRCPSPSPWARSTLVNVRSAISATGMPARTAAPFVPAAASPETRCPGG